MGTEEQNLVSAPAAPILPDVEKIRRFTNRQNSERKMSSGTTKNNGVFTIIVGNGKIDWVSNIK